QREAYRLCTEAELNEQANPRRKAQQAHKPNAACMQKEEKVAGSALAPIFSTCCANGKITLPPINQPPEPLLSLLIREDDIVLYKQNSSLQRISQTYSSYIPLHYVLLFPHRDPGWHPYIFTNNTVYHYNNIVQQFQQYIVDAYTCIEQNCLNYLKYNQKKIHAELYSRLQDALSAHNEIPQTGSQVGHRIVLPFSFVGGPHHIQQLYQDAITIVKQIRKLNLFITMTYNLNWPEIHLALLSALLKDILKNNIFGKSLAYIYVIELQKCGLLHAYMLIILSPNNKPNTTEDYDRIVSAEIPNPHDLPLEYATVIQYMMHEPCEKYNMTTLCMKDSKCSKGYPKPFQAVTNQNENGYHIYRRHFNSHTVKVKEIETYTLHELEDILMQQGKLLKDFSDMPIPTTIYNLANCLLNEELNYNQAMLHVFLNQNLSCLNED
ncbi:12283_t:CDS:2, partial [Dentiscutata erythropus]